MAKEKAKNLTEQMLDDFTKISQVQQSVLLQKNFVTATDDKTMILSLKLDYLGDRKIPLCNLKELIMLLKLKTGKNIDIDFTDEFIEVTDNDNDLKSIYRYSEESLVMHIQAIHKKKMNMRLEKSEDYIKVNLTSDNQLTIKKAMNVFTEPLLAVKKSGDFLRFIVFDKTMPEKCLYEVLSLPIEKSSLKDFDIALFDKNTFNAIFQADYPLYICKDFKEDREFIRFLFEGELTYCVSSSEPQIQGFKIDKFSKFIEKFLKKSDKKVSKTKVKDDVKLETEKTETSKQIEKKIVKNEKVGEALEIEAPKSLDDIDISDFEDFDF